MSTTEINLTTQAIDGTLKPSKISTNSADNFTFPNDVKATGQLQTPSIADLSATFVVDITNRLLKDSTSVITLDWLNRLLKASDGSVSINFNTPGTINATSVLDMNSNSIIHLATPVNPTDAATMAYVQTTTQGLTIKASCEAATTINLSVTAAGSQVGKTLTATTNGALVVDGYTANMNDRILVKNQTTGSDNGIYVTTQTGSASTPFILTRATDFDNSSTVASGDFTFVNNGTVNASSGWVLSTPDPITVDTTSLTFTQFSGAGEIIAGNGLTKTGNELDVHPQDTSLSVHTGDINVARDPAGAVGLTANGLLINTDNTYIGISSNNVTLLNPTQHTVAGSSGQLQYNSSGIFAGTTNITTDGTNIILSNGGITAATITDNTSTLAFDVNGRILYDDNGSSAFVFGSGGCTRQLWDGSNKLAFDFSNCSLTRSLFDTSGVLAIGFSGNSGQRSLYASNGTTVQLNWQTAGTVQLTSAALDMNSHQIHNVTDPVNAQDAATKHYIDTHAFETIVITVSTTTTITTAAQIYLTNAASAAFTVTLPTAASSTNLAYTVKKIDSSVNAVTLQGNGTDTIDGSNTQLLNSQWQSITAVSNGTSWYLI